MLYLLPTQPLSHYLTLTLTLYVPFLLGLELTLLISPPLFFILPSPSLYHPSFYPLSSASLHLLLLFLFPSFCRPSFFFFDTFTFIISFLLPIYSLFPLPLFHLFHSSLCFSSFTPPDSLFLLPFIFFFHIHFSIFTPLLSLPSYLSFSFPLAIYPSYQSLFSSIS